jgi:hypothetical protein
MNHQIFIGIGGMGTDTLRAIKEQVLQRRESDAPDGLEPNHCKFHFLALDVDDMDLYGNKTREDPLTPEEKLELFVPRPMPQHLVQWVQNHAPWYQERELGTQQWSRVHLWCHAEDVCRKVAQLASEGATEDTKVSVHVFAGLAGNTGGGCFTDVCYLVRQALAAADPCDLPDGKVTIRGYGYLPEVMLHRPGLRENQTIRTALMANSYAALQMLNEHKNLAAQDKWFQRDYRNLGTYQTQQPPVDTCFLIGGEDMEKAIASVVKQSLGIPTVADIPAYTLATLSSYPRMGEMEAAFQRYPGIGGCRYVGKRS